MRSLRLIFPILLMLILASCQITPIRRDNNPAIFGGGDVIRWPKEADHVIFRVDVIGGPESFDTRNEIPLCTIYGNNFVIWLDNTQVGRTPVLFDVLDDQEIYNFVYDISVNQKFYTYSSYAAVQPMQNVSPVYEQIILDVNNTKHVVDGFEPNLPAGYFTKLLAACQNISETPARFEPSGGWLSAELAEYNTEATNITWNAEASGINLISLGETGQKIWVDDANLPIIWNIMTNSPHTRLFQQDGLYIRVGFEVPNVHRNAPPAPSEAELAEARRINPDATEEPTEAPDS